MVQSSWNDSAGCGIGDSLRGCRWGLLQPFRTFQLADYRRRAWSKGRRKRRPGGKEPDGLLQQWESQLEDNPPRKGIYLTGLIASGTPAGGIYPTAEIQLDGRRIGIANPINREPRQFNFGFQGSGASQDDRSLLQRCLCTARRPQPLDRTAGIL
jgi:hypothetical protein